MRTPMCAWVVAGVLGCLGILAAPAHADPRSEIAAKTRAAMSKYDAMDYDQARKLLRQALAIAKKARLDHDPVVARVYLDLGITQLASADPDATKRALLSAAQIDPKIAIDDAYRSSELVELLDEAKAAAAAAVVGDDGATQDCHGPRGLSYVLGAPDEIGRRGAAQPLEAQVSGDPTPARVVVMYRSDGAIDFVEARLTRHGTCTYAGSIPASATRGSLVHYYIAAYDTRNHVLAAKGSSGAPLVLELRGGRRPVRKPDRPAAGPAVAAEPSAPATEPVSEPATEPASDLPAPAVTAAPAGDALATRPAPRDRGPRFLLAVSGGTGLGYVSGKTENGNQVQSCCIGSSLLVLSPELGYYLTPRLTLGLAVRLGFPIGANIADHASLAPAAFVRARYALFASAADPGDGLLAMAEAGAGILRNTIKLDASATMATGPGMDTDIVAQGPLLFGAGLGYRRHLGDSLALVIELDILAGLAVTTSFASANHLNSGLSADLSLGLAADF